MRWAFAHRAEVRWRTYEASAEMLEPNTIDEDARNQRIVGAGEPLRKREASSARGEFGIFLRQFNALTGRREDAESPRSNGFLRLLWIAPMKNVRYRQFA